MIGCNSRPHNEDQDAEADGDGSEYPPAVPRPGAVASVISVITAPAVTIVLSSKKCAGPDLVGG